MAVFVDALFTAVPRTVQARRHGRQWCHLCVGRDDALDELHQFAQRLGLKRSYFQEHRYYPHYDLTPRKRDLAVQLGAVEIASRAAWIEQCKRVGDTNE